jgi:hypothetical protein
MLAVALAMAGHSTAELKAVREYLLRPPRDKKILFEMAVTPEQDVLSFIANPKGKWRLSRVRRWLDKEPEEQTIIVPGLALGDRKQWAGPWSAKLIVTPDGKFVVCVTSGFHIGPADRGQDEFVSVVNLLDLKVVSSIHASEVAALSGSYRTYGSDHVGHLIAQVFTPFPRHSGDDATFGGSQVKLTVLSLPDLAVVGQCQYSEWMRSGAIVRREGDQDCGKMLGGSLPDFLSALVDTDEPRRNGRPVSSDGHSNEKTVRSPTAVFSRAISSSPSPKRTFFQ